MSFTFHVLADNPALMDPMWDMETSWPEFMKHDPIGNGYYASVESFADYVVVCLDGRGEVAANAFSVPFRLDGDDLPDDGWDGAIRRGLVGRLNGVTPNHVSAVEIAVRKDLQGTGLSMQVLAALRDNARRHGFKELVAPVRPNGKSDIDEPMGSYAFRRRNDGFPVDPWLRVHVRAGGRIDSVAARSMVIPGTLAEWQDWTDLPFNQTGAVHVRGALAPVHCDVEHGTATYVEPNVWVRHTTGA